MSEALSHDPFHTSDEQPSQPDLVLVTTSNEGNFELTYHPFELDGYLSYLSHPEKNSGVSALIKLLEQLGIIPNELEPTADAKQERQHKIERITNMKDFFDSNYLDPSSPIGKNRAKLLDLFDKTEIFDGSAVIEAITATVKSPRFPESAKTIINEAEYIYRLILADEHKIVLD